MKNVFDVSTTDELAKRINQLTPDSKPSWGKMSVDQMLAHSNVTYDLVFTDKYKKPNAIMKWVLTKFVKPMTVSEKPYQKNSKTAPYFIISDQRNFEVEKGKLIENINRVRDLGAKHFDQKESHSFGKLTSQEWKILFYKHLDHHLTQFDV